MGKSTLRGKDLRDLGFEDDGLVSLAMEAVNKYYKKADKTAKLELLQDLLQNPEKYLAEPFVRTVAEALLKTPEKKPITETALLKEHLPFKVYGKEFIEDQAFLQMETAMRLPPVRAGALMPDAHYGYGLPIGGVLATENAVIPYGVGVDIGCRMCMSLYALPENYIDRNKSRLKSLLGEHTKFGNKEVFERPFEDEVLERKIFDEIKVVKGFREKAWKQIGTSGSGNHFVEFGLVEITAESPSLDLPVGKYVAILSHSGSRGLGAGIAAHYTQLAMDVCKLPGNAKHLAWLDLNSEAGMEYWLAMNLAGDYASACHHHIHRRLSKAMGEKQVAMIENHHNFAWKERMHDGSELIVHRKGATPAGKGVLGIIPGSMTAPGYIVSGKGESLSLASASHGAGRQLSRSKAKLAINPKEMKQYLQKHGVELIGGGPDEAPAAYKDIVRVMAAQTDLVDVLGMFWPKIVRMDGEFN